MARYSETIRDKFDRPIPRVAVNVFNADNDLAALTRDDGATIVQPVYTDEYGELVFNTAEDFYRLEYFVAGAKIRVDNGVPVGAAATLSEQIAVAVVAAVQAELNEEVESAEAAAASANVDRLASAAAAAAADADRIAAEAASIAADWKGTLEPDVIDVRMRVPFVDSQDNVWWEVREGDKTPAELLVLTSTAGGRFAEEVISGAPTTSLMDGANNLTFRATADKIDHPKITALDAADKRAIGSARAARLNGTPYAGPSLTAVTHLIKFGQSNSVNTGDAMGLPVYAGPAATFNGGVHTRRGFGDTDTSGTTGATRTSFVTLRETGSETGMGPALDMFCQLLREEDGIDLSLADLKLLGSSAGVGGINIQQARSTYFFRMVEDFAAAKSISNGLGAGYSVAGVMYNGHESNQLNTPPTLAGSAVATTVANALAVMREMQVDIQAAAQAASGQTWPVPMYLVQLNTHFSTASASYTNANAYWAKAQVAAHINADAVNPNIIFCGPSYQFEIAADGVHFSSIGGAVRDALIGIAMKRVMIDGFKPAIMRPAITSYGKTLRLTFPMASDDLQLRWDTITVPAQTNYGLRVFNGAIGAGTAETISTPRIVGPNVVEIMCANTPVIGLWEVDNAVATSTGGTRGLGNLRDNQGERIIYAPDRFNVPMHNWAPLFREIVQ